MSLDINHSDSQSDAPGRDVARHSLTIDGAAQLFADRGVPRSNRSIQRFCQHGYLDCVRVKSAKGEQFFVSAESAERYAEELRQIEAIASISTDTRRDAPERDTTRNDATQRDAHEQQLPKAEVPDATPDGNAAVVKRLESENLHLRIDNRAKEQVIDYLTSQAQEAQTQLQDVSYRLGLADARVAQLEAPATEDDRARREASEATIVNQPDEVVTAPAPIPPPADSEPISNLPRRSLLGRLLGR